jgi:LPS sulfotransferase NodH
MANNTAKIAELEDILQTGATSATIDGRTVHYDFDEIRRQLRELRANDDSQRGRRPVISRIRLGGC